MKRIPALTILVSASLTLSACDTLTRRTVELPPMVKDGKFNIPPNLIQPCLPFPVLVSGEEEEVVKWAGEAKAVLRDCSLRKDALVKAIQSVK